MQAIVEAIPAQCWLPAIDDDGHGNCPETAR